MRGRKAWALSPTAGLDGPTVPSGTLALMGIKAKPLAPRRRRRLCYFRRLGDAASPAGTPKFHYVEVVLAADARRKIHRQLLAALPDLHVVGQSRKRKTDTELMQTIRIR
jgi:hypothetical protein